MGTKIVAGLVFLGVLWFVFWLAKRAYKAIVRLIQKLIQKVRSRPTGPRTNGSGGNGVIGPEDMPTSIGRLITLGVFLVPAFGLAMLGTIDGNIYTAGGLIVLWFGIVLATSIQIVRARTFWVVERFGYFWNVKFAGPCLIIPWIDNVVLREDFLQKSEKLFEGMTIDFTDGSAQLPTEAWYQIGNPDDIKSGEWGKVNAQVLLYTYRVKAGDRKARIKDIFQSSFRQRLEIGTIADAETRAEELAKESIEGTAASGSTPAREGSKKALEEIGVYPFPGKGIIVGDIVLPSEIQKFRQQKLSGVAQAEEAKARAGGYWMPIAEIIDGLKKRGLGDMDIKEAIQLFLAMEGFKTLKETGANVSFVAADIDSAVRTIIAGVSGAQKGALK